MNDRQQTARKLRMIAAMIEDPEAHAEVAEAVLNEAKKRLRAGAQRLLDRYLNDTKKE